MNIHQTDDFWELCRLQALPEEVRNYAPKVFAAITITKQLDAYGFKRPRYPPVFTFDSVRVWNPLSLQQVSKWTGASVKHLRALNPSLRRDSVPPGEKSFILRLPPSSAKNKFQIAYRNHLNKLDEETKRDYLIFDPGALQEFN
jgi:membrane-bound lytic murein transglycosylase D